MKLLQPGLLCCRKNFNQRKDWRLERNRKNLSPSQKGRFWTVEYLNFQFVRDGSWECLHVLHFLHVLTYLNFLEASHSDKTLSYSRTALHQLLQCYGCTTAIEVLCPSDMIETCRKDCIRIQHISGRPLVWQTQAVLVGIFPHCWTNQLKIHGLGKLMTAPLARAQRQCPKKCPFWQTSFLPWIRAPAR